MKGQRCDIGLERLVIIVATRFVTCSRRKSIYPKPLLTILSCGAALSRNMKSDLLALAAIAMWSTLATLGLSLAHLPPFLLTGLSLLVGSLIAIPLARGICAQLSRQPNYSQSGFTGFSAIIFYSLWRLEQRLRLKRICLIIYGLWRSSYWPLFSMPNSGRRPPSDRGNDRFSWRCHCYRREASRCSSTHLGELAPWLSLCDRCRIGLGQLLIVDKSAIVPNDTNR